MKSDCPIGTEQESELICAMSCSHGGLLGITPIIDELKSILGFNAIFVSDEFEELVHMSLRLQLIRKKIKHRIGIDVEIIGGDETKLGENNQRRKFYFRAKKTNEPNHPDPSREEFQNKG